MTNSQYYTEWGKTKSISPFIQYNVGNISKNSYGGEKNKSKIGSDEVQISMFADFILKYTERPKH